MAYHFLYLSCQKSKLGVTYITVQSRRTFPWHFSYVVSEVFGLTTRALVTEIENNNTPHLFEFVFYRVLLFSWWKYLWFDCGRGLASEVLEALLSPRPPHNPPLPIKYPKGLPNPKWIIFIGYYILISAKLFFTIILIWMNSFYFEYLSDQQGPT